jgi:OmpA-OmpF porin, OOP family
MRRQKNASRHVLGVLFGAAVTLAPAVAAAQASTFYLDRLYMAGAPDDGIGIWRPEVSDKVRFFGQLGIGFQLNPFRNENYIDGSASGVANPVDTQTSMYLNVGAELLKRIQLQIALPVILGQTTNPTVGSDAISAGTSAPGDMRIEARGVLFRNDARSFRLAANAFVGIPSGDALSWGGEGAASGYLGLAAEYDLKSFYIDVNTGFMFRPRSDINNRTFVVGNDWRYGLGAYFPLRDNTFRLGVSVFGTASIEGDAAFGGDNSTLEWMAEGKMALDEKKRLLLGFGGGTRLTPGYAPDMRLVATIGYHIPITDTVPPSPPKKFRAPDDGIKAADTDKDGLPDDIDLCPTEPEDHKPPNADDGCPMPPDRDGDGIPDSSDKCPDQPEDFDKIDDQDGCPEEDFDGDSIGDAVDACPKEPGEPSGEKDKNGCPVFIRRVEGSTEIEILKQVQFATGSAKILSNSFKILDEVVKLMTVNKDIKLVAIEGHTDNRGSAQLNEKLSDDRANSVRQYIIDKGIHPDRLTAKGFGPQRPIADNKTAEGQQKNRRVEFHIRDRAGAQPEGGTPAPEPAPPQ